MATHYFIHNDHNLRTTNKLQKAVSEYIRSLNGKLILSHDLEHVKESIIQKILELNIQYNRCKPIDPQFHEMHSGEISLYGLDFSCLRIRPAELKYKHHFRNQGE
ncbi:MAG: hypothetical protein BM557_01175 [Flavobacterium sp. MedPE-SWcel]|uniref:hypothetical protein n=1 Tax=uncultured Flavobacterium sp. TaxID=165435 RepID=UPI00091A9EE2|nr:hypothetical protein [uncultured Flavobacterium sp.]OIQ22019.1 MAG: hypothetical protein BM557_01175 [Flavobacterium sp. MedPE-SWcel]